MEKLTIKEIKSRELELLLKISNLIDSLNLNYSLAGGTLLGAIRHKGFIPWDDDIDIIMPRPDYNKLIDFFKNNNVNSLKLLCHELNESYSYLFAKIADTKTILVERNGNKQVDYGICVDIFPIDSLGNSLKEAKKIYKKTRYKRYLLVASNWRKFTRSKTRPLYQEIIRYFFYIRSRHINKKKIISIIESKYINNSFTDTKYVGSVCGVYDEKEILNREIFDNYTYVDFENNKFKSIANFDVYLKALYGDYMKLPPIDKRVTHHNFDVYEVQI